MSAAKSAINSKPWQRGSISMIETVLIMGIGLLILLAAVGFGTGVSNSSKNDACLVAGTGAALDLADPSMNAESACASQEYQTGEGGRESR